MTTINSEPVASLLDRLFTEADASRANIPAAFAGMTDDQAHAMLGSRTEYLDLYTRMKDLPLPVSREAGSLLYMLARFGNARMVVEFGTSFGISTLHLAAAIRDNGGGRIITTEFEPSKIVTARENLKAGGLLDLVEIREGDALETLSRDLPAAIDLVLLDGAKGLYNDILDRIESRLRPGALLLGDNADMCPDYLERVRAAGGGYLSIPFGGDVELSMRIG
jgi:predicted O-methyltransferase YrrM